MNLLLYETPEELNDMRANDARVISPDRAPVTIGVVPTNEELAIAQDTAALLQARS